MTVGLASPPSVLVSYSHDSEAHRQRVLALADRLRADGIDVRLDRYVESPPEGWPRWTERQAVESTFVLVVCTPTYREHFERTGPADEGKGVAWEAMIVRQILYDAGTRNERLVPVLLEDGADADVPLSLRAYTRYRLMEQYDALYRRLTDQPAILVPPIGAIKPMPPAGRPMLVDSHRGGASASDVGTRIVAGTTAAAEPSDDAFVDELARVLHDEEQAWLVAQRAGLSPTMIPAFRTPLVFWTKVVSAARNGAIPGGAPALAEAAARLFPGNALLRAHVRRSAAP